ncbi:hypothetical protein TWF281_003326 [Arthrobotrys megalospora]
MDHVYSRVESSLLHVAVPFACTPAITRLSGRKSDAVFNQAALERLIEDFNDTKQQLSPLRDLLERAEFSEERHRQYDVRVRGVHLDVNTVTNLIDQMAMKLAQKGFFRRSKYRLSLVNRLRDIKCHIEKIDRRIGVIRQEMMAEISINSRNEIRNQNIIITQEVQRVNKNLTGTDARRIRQIYSRVAVDLMDPWSFLVVSPAPSSQQNPHQPAEDNNRSITPASAEATYTETLSLNLTQLDVEVTPPGSTHLADVQEAISKILERSASEPFTFPRYRGSMPRIAELPA